MSPKITPLPVKFLINPDMTNNLSLKTVVAPVVAAMLCVASSCERRAAESFPVVDITAARTAALNASDYIAELEYVALETTDGGLVGGAPQVYVTDRFIVTVDGNANHLFDRRTGRWLRKVGSRGRGPREYLSAPFGGELMDPEGTRLYMSQEGSLIEYPLADSTTAPRTFPFPSLMASSLASLGEDRWATAPLNLRGDEPNRVVFYGTAGATDSVPNHDRFTRVDNNVNVNPFEVMFYRYGGETYYKNMFNDTLYVLTDNAMRPSRVFRAARPVKALGELRGDLDAMIKEVNSYHRVSGIVETDNLLLFTAQHDRKRHAYLLDTRHAAQSALWTKGGREAAEVEAEQGLSTDAEQGRSSEAEQGRQGRQKRRAVAEQEIQWQPVDVEGAALANDIDGGMPFWPARHTAAGQLVQVLSPLDIKKTLTEEYFAEHPAKDPAAHKRLRELVKNIKEDDNPVIVIAKLKK